VNKKQWNPGTRGIGPLQGLAWAVIYVYLELHYCILTALSLISGSILLLTPRGVFLRCKSDHMTKLLPDLSPLVRGFYILLMLNQLPYLFLRLQVAIFLFSARIL
jgi:hypothetical protein